ncbi:MAG: hypothetical protein A3J55_04470 [Candidatus Ryanbacteria bacterium RIFCSPHIGHO2_02_FULL_45_17b]|nr:MAG: hypothetical protein A3J55_04470 [Candidatus Ryanbacteria bacterium RIFCSPHIGHO2_02_FULL_45_17b]
MDEQARYDLERRCHESVGATEPGILTTVLSYFPETAELFIRTQDYAASVEGRRHLWYNVRHQTAGYGLDRSEYYQADQIEHLYLRGFTGNDLINIITEVNVMRGLERGHDNRSVEKIIHVARKIPGLREMDNTPFDDTPLSYYEQMVAKTLEVMKVTWQEVRLLRAYQNMGKQADVYLVEMGRLNRRVAALRTACHTVFPSMGLEREPPYEQWQKLRQAVKEQGITISRGDDRAKFVLDAEFGEMCVLANAAEVFKLIVLAFRHGRGTDGPCGVLLNLYAFRDELASGKAGGVIWHRHLSDTKNFLPEQYVTFRCWLKEEGYDVEQFLSY